MQIVVVVFGLHNGVVDICAGNVQPAYKIIVFGVQRGVFRVNGALRQLLYLLLCGRFVFQINDIRVGSFKLAAVADVSVRVQGSVLKIMRGYKHNGNDQHDKRRKENDFPDNLVRTVSLAWYKSRYDAVPYALLFAFFLFFAVLVTMRSKTHIHFCHCCSSFQSLTSYLLII